MNEAPPVRGAAWRSAARGAASALAVSALVAAAGQSIGLVLYIWHGAEAPYWPYARLGAVYDELFHHVPVAVRLSAPRATPLTARLGIALLLVTIVGVALLGRTGRRFGPGASAAGAVLLVVASAAGYAIVPFALAHVARGGVRLPVGVGLGVAASVDVSVAQAFVAPFAIAAVAVTFGALSSGVTRAPGDRVGDVVAGGLRAAGLAMLLAVVGLLVVASVEPAFARAYGGVIAAPDRAGARAVLAAHAVLLLPNQAVWVIVPAMGACDEIVLDGAATPFLCYWRRPTGSSVHVGSRGDGPIGDASASEPPGYLAFLLVPLVATVAGGARAARESRSPRGRVVAGSASGIVFAGAMAVAIALARIDVAVGGGFLGASSHRLTVGPELIRGVAIALAWGVVGGAVGGVVAVVASRHGGAADVGAEGEPSRGQSAAT